VGSTGAPVWLGLLTRQAQALQALLASRPAASNNPPLLQAHSRRSTPAPRVMLDTITLPGNLVVVFGVPECPKIDAQESTPPHTRERLPSQWEVVRVVPGRFPCTAQKAIYVKPYDELASQDSFSNRMQRVPQSARLQMDQSI
jgi:hypothetical protein